MTFIGHTLTGMAIGVACLPTGARRSAALLQVLGFGLLANLPDFPLPYWGHHRYFISHSLFVNALLIFVLALTLAIWKKPIFDEGNPWRVTLTGAAAAWLSHLLLDTFYNHGKGLLMFWPFSTQRLALPIPWFSVLRDIPPPFTADTLRIFGVEFAFYGGLLLGVVLLRSVWKRRRAV